MAYLLADAKVTIFRRICSAGMKNVISRFARGGQRGELSSYKENMKKEILRERFERSVRPLYQFLVEKVKPVPVLSIVEMPGVYEDAVRREKEAAEIVRSKSKLTMSEQLVLEELMKTPLGRSTFEEAYQYLRKVPVASAEYPRYIYQNKEHSSVMRFVWAKGEWCITLYKVDSDLAGVVIPYEYKGLFFFVVFVKVLENFAELDWEEFLAQTAVKVAAKAVFQAPSDDEEEKERIIREAEVAIQTLNSLYFGEG